MGNGRQVVIAPGALGWRMNRLPVHVDDALNRMNQKALNLGVVFRDDDKAVVDIGQRRTAGRHGQIKNRDSAAPNTGYTPNNGARSRHDGEFGALQHLLHLEHVYPI